MTTIAVEPSIERDGVGGAIRVHPGSAARQSLEAQAALLPYALAAFAVGLPIFAWVCSVADDRYWMVGSLVIFAINWAAFYGLVDWLRRHPAERNEIGLRTRIHLLGGLLWSLAVVQMTLLAQGAGPARETLLLVAAGAAMLCTFFSAPSLATLLIVAPAAAAPPILALYARESTRATGHMTLAAIALVMALCLVLNRLLRGLFILAGDRERLIDERAGSLVQAQKLARSKSDLVATLSNEIRTGLASVVDVLAAASGAGGRIAPSREQMSAALGSARDLIAVLNVTLDSELAEAGRLSVAERPYDPSRLARDVVLLNTPVTAAKGLELAIHIDEALETAAVGAAIGDAARARQVLTILIDNAIKYTLRGRVEVRVELASDDRLRFAVADTGPGLSGAELEQAFAAFNRIERTAAGVPGAGLGLSLARRLAELMGGELAASSAPGVGSCFQLTLPFDPSARIETEGDAEAGITPTHGESRRVMRVLLAEPDALQAAKLRAVLEQLGHQVVLAQKARRAQELARTCDFDLVMINGRVAEAEGPELIVAIRELEAPVARAAVVALIEGEAGEAKACLDAGADAVMRPPINVANVARTLAAAQRAVRDRAAVVPGRPALTVVERAV